MSWRREGRSTCMDMSAPTRARVRDRGPLDEHPHTLIPRRQGGATVMDAAFNCLSILDYMRSNTAAIPWPPPMHMVTRA
jgi:hypothetical protein